MQISSEPYIGPRPFEQTDRDIFFGRTQEANELVSLITAHAAVLLYAQSGAGKTSLVKAGLIPLLVDEEKFTVIPPMRVRENVAASLKPEGVDNVYMFNALASISEPDAVAGLAGLALTDYLMMTRQTGSKGDSCGATIIILDQFEELFTLYPERWEDRADFFKQVRDALKGDPLLRVLFSMREDFIAELDPYLSLMPEKLRTRLRIERLREKTALGAVTQPLEKVQTPNGRRKFAPYVAEELVKNLLLVKVKSPDGIKKVKSEFVEALQLQVVCQALWQNLKADDELITKADLEAYGDVDKALAQFYENAINKTIEKKGIKQWKLRQWFERALITPTGTRGTVFRGQTETGGIPNEVVDELENQRIIRMELRGGAQWYELPHDRFVETVQLSNQGWLLSRPATEQVRKGLEEKAADWDHNDQDDKYLLDDVELHIAEEWMGSSDAAEIEPSRDLTAFVRASKQLSETKRRESIERRHHVEQQARTASLFRRLAMVVSLLAVVCLVALVLAGAQWKKAKATAREAERLRADADVKNQELEKKNNDLINRDLIIGNSTILTQAYTSFTAGDLTDAETQFNSVLAMSKTNSQHRDIVRTYLNLGDISLKRDDWKAAISQYEEALKWLPPNGQLANQEGQAYAKKAVALFEWGKRREDKKAYNDAESYYKGSISSYVKALGIFKKTGNLTGQHDAKIGLDVAKRFQTDLKKLKQEAETLESDESSAPTP